MKLSITIVSGLLPSLVQGTKTTFPYSLENCGIVQSIPDAPTKAVTLNQGATEVLLALGLEGSMAGHAYIDDIIWPAFETAYNSVPELSTRYPTIEQIVDAEADFLYASYSSAFSGDGSIGYIEYLKK